jgi:hypothetical protein
LPIIDAAPSTIVGSNPYYIKKESICMLSLVDVTKIDEWIKKQNCDITIINIILAWACEFHNVGSIRPNSPPL